MAIPPRVLRCRTRGGIVRLDDRRARPGGTVNGGALVRPFILTIDGPDRVCYRAAVKTKFGFLLPIDITDLKPP